MSIETYHNNDQDNSAVRSDSVRGKSPAVRRFPRTAVRRFPRTAVRRFPRTKQGIGILLQKLKVVYQSGNIRLLRLLVSQIQGKIDRSLSQTDLEVAERWDSLPRFDPSTVKTTRWLINSFVAEGSIQLIVGERGSFKSTLLLFAAGAVAAGNHFLDMKTRRRRVLYLDYENPASVIKARNIDLKLDLPHNENLIVWDRFGDKQPPKPGDFLLEAIVSECLVETGHGPWIIFDSWASLLKPGEGGEFTGQIAPLYLQLRRLTDLGATITVLDHTRKYERGTTYGGQDKEAKADSIHKLFVSEAKSKPIRPIIRVESWLKRAAPAGEGSFAFEVRSTQARNGNWHIVNLARAQDPEMAKMQEAIALLRSLIKQNPDLGQDALSKLAVEQGLPRDYAIRLLKDGIGKYWQIRRTSHNKLCYSLIQ